VGDARLRGTDRKNFFQARLDGVDLGGRAGECTACWANGAGKSTLIKVLSCAHQPDEGTIRCRRDRSPSARPPPRLNGASPDLPELDLVDGSRWREHLPGP